MVIVGTCVTYCISLVILEGCRKIFVHSILGIRNDDDVMRKNEDAAGPLPHKY